MKKWFWAVLFLLLAVLACTNPATPTSTPGGSETPPTEVSATPSVPPTGTSEPPTATLPPPTATAERPLGGQLVRNGGMEFFDYKRNMTWFNDGGGFGNWTPRDWEVGFRDINYLAEAQFTYYACADAPEGWEVPPQCSELDGAGRRWDDKDGRPEFKISIPDRARSGYYAAAWHSFYRPAVGWYQQEIYLPSRDYDTTCIVEFYQHWWLTDGTTDPEVISIPPLARATHDDKLEARLMSQVGTDWVYYSDDDDSLASHTWTHPDIAYDTYNDEPYTYEFELPHDVPRIVLQIGGYATWGWRTQDFYLDDVSLRCHGIDFQPITPTPEISATPTSVLTPGPETPIPVTPVGGEPNTTYFALGQAYFFSDVILNVRECTVASNAACPVLYQIQPGERAVAFCVDVQDDGDVWLCLGDYHDSYAAWRLKTDLLTYGRLEVDGQVRLPEDFF